MAPPCLHSFQGTPILFITEQVSFGLPVLADEVVHAILRDVWLDATWRDRWFVGPYAVLPDRVSFLASGGPAACAPETWAARWKSRAVARIKRATGRGGLLWESGLGAVPVRSAEDYWGRLEVMREPVTPRPRRPGLPGRSGMLWQLL